MKNTNLKKLTTLYKSFNFLPNIIENKNEFNDEVRILNRINESHYLALYKNIVIWISSVENLDAYVGQTILTRLYKKFISQSIQIGNIYYPLKTDSFIFNTSDTNNNKFISKGSEDYTLTTQSAINTNNIGKTITVNYLPLKYSSFSFLKESINKNDGYELLSILQTGEYVFKDVNNSSNIFACYFIKPFKLDNKLGSVFNLLYSDYYILINIKSVIENLDINNNFYVLSEILDNTNIIIFTKKNVRYAVYKDKFTIADSFLGISFDLDIRPYIYGEIIDVN
jgi:hypothetical protein